MKIDLEKLKQEVPAWKVIQRYVQLSKSGNQYVGLCPFHADSTPSFAVFNKGEGWFWKCFPCGENGGGDVIDFLKRIENITTGQAIEKLKEFAGHKEWHDQAAEAERHFQSMGDTFDTAEKKPKSTITMEAWARAEKALAGSPSAIAWLQEERGVSLATAQAARLGFCQRVNGHVEEEENRDKGWVMFPRILDDKIVTCKMRCIAAKDFSQITNMRQDTLFNAETISPFDPIYVTEGEMDALVLEQAGFRAVSLPMAGFRLTPHMSKALKEASCIFLAGDNDGAAGTDYMRALKKQFKDNTYLITWPDVKDANDFFRKTCKRNIDTFRTQVNRLSAHAKNNPIEGVYGLLSAMDNADGTDLMDNPHRLHWRQTSVDRMAIVPPGGVVTVYSSYSGSGKSTLVADCMLHEAKRGEVILVYSAEMSVDENIRIVASHILQKDRGTISRADFAQCAKVLRDSNAGRGKGFQYYIGYNPDLQGHDAVLDFIETAVRTFGVTRVVLDHLHFIIQAAEGGSIEAQEKAMKRIKNMAVTYGLIFVVVAQSNKEGQSVKNLKNDEHGVIMGSTSLSSDAHAVYLLHRKVLPVDDPANPPVDRLSNDSDIILKKVRTKGPGNAFTRLIFNGKLSTFAEQAFQKPPSAAVENDPDSV